MSLQESPQPLARQRGAVQHAPTDQLLILLKFVLPRFTELQWMLTPECIWKFEIDI